MRAATHATHPADEEDRYAQMAGRSALPIKHPWKGSHGVGRSTGASKRLSRRAGGRRGSSAPGAALGPWSVPGTRPSLGWVLPATQPPCPCVPGSFPAAPHQGAATVSSHCGHPLGSVGPCCASPSRSAGSWC